jgi:hypothetical protein
MFTIGSAPLDSVLPDCYGSGGCANDDHLQRGGAGLTDEELAQRAMREVLLILDDAAACRAAQNPPRSNLDEFLGYMRREGYTRAATLDFDPVLEAARGAAPWRSRDYPGEGNPDCSPPENVNAPATSCDGGGTRKAMP